MNRRDDHLWFGATLGGFFILAATFFLRWKAGLADTPYSIGLLLGAGMIAPHFVADMVRRWRANGDRPPG